MLENPNFSEKRVEKYSIVRLREILSNYLAAHGYSPETYADICGVNSRTIRKIRDGEDIDIRIGTLEQLLEPMGISVWMIRNIE